MSRLMMAKVSTLLTNVTDFYKSVNPSTLSGAIDIVCVEHEDGSLSSSPFHVRFGKLQLLRPHEKIVEVSINDRVVDLAMKVGEHGEAFFVVERDADGDSGDEVAVDPGLATSPIARPMSDEAVVAAAAATVPALFPEVIADMTTDAAAVTADAPASLLEPLDLGASLTDLREHDSSHLSPTTMAVSAAALVPAADVEAEANAYHSASEFELSDSEPVRLSSTVPMSAPLPSRPTTTSTSITISSTMTTTATAKPSHPSSSSLHTTIDISKFDDDPSAPTKHIHPFSDTELDVEQGPAIKNIGSPVSDTELEFHELAGSGDGSSAAASRSNNRWSWGWGKMPVNRAVSPDGRTLTNGEDTPMTRDLIHGHAHDGDSAAIEMSLAGYRSDLNDADFTAKIISHAAFVIDPVTTLRNPALVVRMDGQYYPWSAAAPMIACMLAFNNPLPPAVIDSLVSSTAPQRKSTWRAWWSRSPQQPSPNGGGPASPAHLLGEFHDDPPSMAEMGRAQSDVPMLVPTENAGDAPLAAREVSPSAGGIGNASSTTIAVAGGGNAAAIGLRTQSAGDVLETSASGTTAGGGGGEGDAKPPASPTDGPSPTAIAPPRKTYLKSLRLTSDQLKSLGLKPGANYVTFTVKSSLQGSATCHSRIFLWSSNERVVISDIDGTITKSDALGHIFTMLGRDWTHSGVASLYTRVRRNGYQMLYLTSRAIGQAQYTRNYLNKVEQDTFQLPDGPVFLSPDRLVAAFTREIIQRRPEEFKVACLRDIRALFGPDTKHPFYAGFGNRHTDAYSYRAVGVPTSRIFTINPAGELKRELLEGYTASYVDLGHLVDQIFPPIGAVGAADAEFNDWNFWRRDMGAVAVDIPELADDPADAEDEDDLGEPVDLDALPLPGGMPEDEDDDLDDYDSEEGEYDGDEDELENGGGDDVDAGAEGGPSAAATRGISKPGTEASAPAARSPRTDHDLDRLAEFAAYPYI
ncbi:Lipin/Ned1/Smp2-domain-containing protein [Blastocladiella britannica]|nr:Lipin/Ned1/Smp2-domain-containing protein [Blastocladiella britannica]